MFLGKLKKCHKAIGICSFQNLTSIDDLIPRVALTSQTLKYLDQNQVVGVNHFVCNQAVLSASAHYRQGSDNILSFKFGNNGKIISIIDQQLSRVR